MPHDGTDLFDSHVCVPDRAHLDRRADECPVTFPNGNILALPPHVVPDIPDREMRCVALSMAFTPKAWRPSAHSPPDAKSRPLLATGFDRVPSPDGVLEYSAGRFFLATYAAGTLYDYRVELPTINLVKLHGCLSRANPRDRLWVPEILAPELPEILAG